MKTDASANTALARYRSAFESTWAPEAPSDGIRFVVLDCETTGLDARKDRLISIGAVAVRSGDIVLEDSFEALLKIDYNLSAVTVHGITRDESRGGLDEGEALRDFIDYLGDGVIVGHHILHDVTSLNVALERNFELTLENRWLDTMDLALHLEQAGAFGAEKAFEGFSLDALCSFFEVTPHDRHTATGDALLTAVVFLKLLRIARAHGRGTLGALCERFEPSEPDR